MTNAFSAHALGKDYGDRPALLPLDLEVPLGQHVALVGHNGSGKTTLINLLARFHDVSDGAVLVGDIDVRQQRRSDLYRTLGIVPQRAYLFGGSVRDNVRFGAQQLTD